MALELREQTRHAVADGQRGGDSVGGVERAGWQAEGGSPCLKMLAGHEILDSVVAHHVLHLVTMLSKLQPTISSIYSRSHLSREHDTHK